MFTGFHNQSTLTMVEFSEQRETNKFTINSTTKSTSKKQIFLQENSPTVCYVNRDGSGFTRKR